MAEETKKFQEVEEKAQQFVETLETLKNESVSYKNSTAELERARENLTTLTETLQTIGQGTLDVVKLMKDIGGPEIFKQINQLKYFLIIGFTATILLVGGILAVLLK